RKGQVLRRHHPTASGRACPRVVDRCLADGAGDRRHRAGAATLPAGNGLTALLCSFLPSCQGAKTPLWHPGAFCAYATVVMATSVSDFRQCPEEKKTYDELKLQQDKALTDREQGEMKYLGDYIKYALEKDPDVRLRFSQYFAKLTISDALQKKWSEYHTL